ncbi:GDP-fucose protein O-fucosyltransferase 2 [Armadillidium vulgare]|nr:GDP-fucose protein O-fucosyltransferase 2 [Armadillidium vulgare]
MYAILGYLICISFVIIYGQSCEARSLKRDLGSGVGPLQISEEIKKMLEKKWDDDEETNEITEEDYEEVYDDLKDYLTDETDQDDVEEVEDSHHHENCDKELHEDEKLPANYKDQIERIMQIYASTLVSSKYFRSCRDGRKLEVLQHLFNLKEKIKKDEKPKSRSEGKFFFTIKSLRSFSTKDLLRIFESSVSELNNCG